MISYLLALCVFAVIGYFLYKFDKARLMEKFKKVLGDKEFEKKINSCKFLSFICIISIVILNPIAISLGIGSAFFIKSVEYIECPRGEDLAKYVKGHNNIVVNDSIEVARVKKITMTRRPSVWYFSGPSWERYSIEVPGQIDKKR